MATTIVTKYGSDAPAASDIVRGELAVDTENGRLYTENAAGAVVEIGLKPEGNVDVTGVVTADAIEIDDTDDIRLRFLNASAFKGGIQVVTTAGDMIATSAVDDLAIRSQSDILFSTGGNIERMKIVDTGIDVTGSVTADGLTVEADSGGGGGSTTPVVAVISDTDGGGSWVSGTIFAATDYKSGDGSGAGSGVRVRTGIAQEASSGATSSYIVQTAPTTAGTMLDRLKISSGGDISFYEDTGTTAKFFWDASAESLGIGTTSPAQPLEILKTSAGAVVPMIQLRNGSSSAGSGTSIKFMHSTVSNATSGTCELESIRYSGNLGALTFKTSNNGGTVTERMRINDAGVGINRIPTEILDILSVSGDARIRLEAPSGSDTEIKFFNDGAAQYTIGHDDGTDNFVIGTANVDGPLVSVTKSGNLLVGKTSTGDYVTGIEMQPAGAILSYRTTNVASIFGRTNEGEITRFTSAGAIVGTIGSRSAGANLYIAFRPEAGGDGCGLTGSAASNGAIIPSDGNGDAVDDHIDLGAAGTRFDDIYATSGTVNSSDGNEKQDIEELSDAEQRVALACKGLLRKFRWISRVAEKGDDARIHFGIIAQDLQAAFEAEGLDAGRYGMFINGTWTDEETGEERSRMGVRYSELLAFIIAAI